jgi:hypothetical protein
MASRIKAAVEAGKTKREEEKKRRLRLADLRKDHAASDATHSGGMFGIVLSRLRS